MFAFLRPLRQLLFFALFTAISCTYAFADVSEIIKKYVPDTHVVGKGRLNLFMWDIYDAALYASKGKWHSDQPYALSISYLRDVSSHAIAKFSHKEMNRVQCASRKKTEKWTGLIQDFFPDVQKGTVLTGIRSDDGSTIFYHNDKRIGSVADPAFGDCFFAIWLDEKTSSKELRMKLLGLVE